VNDALDLSRIFGTGLGEAGWEPVALAMLLAFVLGKVIAFTYERTYEGVSYSRSFMQSLVLGALVSTVLMLAIGDNLARGLGILGTMALVRFRTTVRDSRDMIFIFAALAAGVASGVRSYPVAVVGTLGFCVAAGILQWSPFGRRQRFDGLLRFWLPRQGTGGDAVGDILRTHCRDYVLVALREAAQGTSLEYAYQVRLRASEGRDQLVRALEALPGIGGLTLLLEEAHGEL
jgi:hypothetical protein